MDNYLINASKILKNYAEFTNIECDDIGIVFSFNGVDYKIWIFSEDKTSMPIITTVNNTTSYPHISLFDAEFDDKKYRGLCLFEQGTVVNSLLSFDEKIQMLADRLIELATLSKNEIEKEYQKEFLYYWNASVEKADKKYQLFLKDDSKCEWLDQCLYKNNVVRVIDSSFRFNDESNMIAKDKIPALYMPILDARGILPPLIDKPWEAKNILDIVCSIQFQRINIEIFQEILCLSYSRQSIMLIFKLDNMYFACLVKFKNAGTAKLIRKLENQISEVIPISIQRCDFSFLNQQIGNDLSLIDKKIAIIGAGSLGSYVAAELIRAGCKSILIIDNDKLEPPNIMRHRLPLNNSGFNKSLALAFTLEQVHPEIQVEFIRKKVDNKNCIDIIPSDIDVVIFTVGNSDVQLRCNMQYKNQHFQKPVLFSWLEGDGCSSHVLGICYNLEGCFECLFTDIDGNMVNNQANITNESTIQILRNGCGGTRVAYGNSTLLTATVITLQALKDIISKNFKQNFVIHYTDSKITKDYNFIKGRCRCCGENQ